jgi:hypothetical protein
MATILPGIEATAFTTWLRESASLLPSALVLIPHAIGLV